MEQKSDKQQDTSPAEEPSLGRENFRWFGYGLELAGVMAIFTYAGWRLDERWGTRPWLMVALMLVPMIGIERNGATRWLNLGIAFQPSEFLIAHPFTLQCLKIVGIK